MAPTLRLTIKDKLDIIEKEANGQKARALSKEYKVNRSSIYKILKQKNEIKSFSQNRNSKKLKKISTVKYEDLEDLLITWFKEKRSEGYVVTGITLKRQALRFANEIGLLSFKSSNGWLQKFKNRWGVRALAVTGELLDSVEDSEVLSFLSNFTAYIEENQLSPCQVYNSDETGLFFKKLPSKTFVTQDEKSAPGRKSCKERITVQMCCNSTGDNKVRLMVIGRSKKPRCFHRRDFAVNEYVYYKSNKTAWMTSSLFDKWFHDEFVPSVRSYSSKMGIAPKALLLVDNAPSHPKNLTSDDGLINVMFLPPRSTPVLQPMDIGIIRPFKSYYTRELTEKVTNECAISVNLKDLSLDKVVLMADNAWKEISYSTIINSFGHLFGGADFILGNLPDPPNHFDATDLIPLNVVSNHMNSMEQNMDADIDLMNCNQQNSRGKFSGNK